jgi:hypothetical protein
MLNWDKTLKLLLKRGMTEEGGWNAELYQLIAEVYNQPRDHTDVAVQCILICIHQAVQGNANLDILTTFCTEYIKGSNMSEVVKVLEEIN